MGSRPAGAHAQWPSSLTAFWSEDACLMLRSSFNEVPFAVYCYRELHTAAAAWPVLMQNCILHQHTLASTWLASGI